MPSVTYKIFVVSLPGSSKRDVMTQRLTAQNLSWEWSDGVIIPSMDDIPWKERDGLEAYNISRLKQAPEYVCRAIGCKRAMRKVIAKAETCSEDWVLILQDDAVLAPDFDQKFTNVLQQAPYEAGCVMLHHIGGGLTNVQDWRLVTGNVRSMTAFAIRPCFAQTMSEALSVWNGETDRIWERLAREGEIIIAPPNMLVTCNQKGSDIIGGIPELRGFWK